MQIRDAKGKFLAGTSGNPDGIPKGLKQKSTMIKEAFIDAFEKTGGVKELIKWVKKSESNRKEFYSFLIRMLPREIDLDADVRETPPLTPQFSVIFSDAIPDEEKKDIASTPPLPAKEETADE